MSKEKGKRKFAALLVLAGLILFAGDLTALMCHAENGEPIFHVGSELDFPPYAFVDEKGQPAGFSVDLIKAVADAMGLSIRIATGSWDTMWNSLVAGQLDALPIVARSRERQRLVDFSLPHTETFDAFFVRKGDAVIQNIAAARGKEIVVMHSDAAHHELLARNFQGKLVLVDTIPEGLSLIASGKHDALLCSKLIGTLLIKKNRIEGLAAGPILPDYRRVFSFAVKKGDTELLEKLNQGLLIVKTKGEYRQIYEKWLTYDDPWQKLRKYLLPVVVILTAIAFFVVFWLITLGRVIRKRTAELVEKNEMLRHAYADMELRVQERTAELSQANQSLQSDITARKRVEEELREAHERAIWLARFPEENPSPIVRVSREGKILYCNPAARDLPGWTCEVGCLLPKLLQSQIVQVMGEGKEKEQEVELGGRFYYFWAAPFLADGYVNLYGRDITDHKQMEEELRRSHDELEKRVRERTEELTRSHQRLQQLAAQLLKAQEEERRRIAQELHDSIGASLGAIKFKMVNAIERMEQGAPALGSLKDLIPIVQLAIEESRRIMADLRPSMLDDLGILPTISWHCREFEKIYSHIGIEKRMDITEKDVPAPLKTVIYRILQEAMNNIAKHSNANLISLFLKKKDDRIELVIEDNGIGFDMEGIEKGDLLLSEWVIFGIFRSVEAYM